MRIASEKLERGAGRVGLAGVSTIHGNGLARNLKRCGLDLKEAGMVTSMCSCRQTVQEADLPPTIRPLSTWRPRLRPCSAVKNTAVSCVVADRVPVPALRTAVPSL